MTAIEKLKEHIGLSLSKDTFVRLTLSKPRDASSDLKKLIVKYVFIKEKPHLSFYA